MDHLTALVIALAAAYLFYRYSGVRKAINSFVQSIKEILAELHSKLSADNPHSEVPSLDEYQKANPQCVDANGDLTCRYCRARKTYVEVGYSPDKQVIHRLYICRQCDRVLWKSVGNIM